MTGKVVKRCKCHKSNWSRCTHPWCFRIQWKGTRYKISVDRYADKPIKGRTDADSIANRIRKEIMAGSFRLTDTPTPTVMTLDAYVRYFVKHYSQKRGKKTWDADQSKLQRFANFTVKGQRLGVRPVDQITEDTIDDFLASLKCTHSTFNKYLTVLKSASNFGYRKKHLPTRWIQPESDLVKKSEKASQRHRRLTSEEERDLLAVAPTRLYRLITAALETAGRRGDLLKLQWRNVNFETGTVTFLGANAKKDKTRVVPITNKLRAILQMAKTDPAGREFEPDAFVFGDFAGRDIKRFDRSWMTAILKSHGFQPEWSNAHALTAASLKTYKQIDLHFHDLRHEAGSRWLERGVPLHHIKNLLGHANISQTDTYLNASTVDLQKSMLEAESRTKSGPKVAQIEIGARPQKQEEKPNPAIN